MNDSFNPNPERTRKIATPVPPNGVSKLVPKLPPKCWNITNKIAIPLNIVEVSIYMYLSFSLSFLDLGMIMENRMKVEIIIIELSI